MQDKMLPTVTVMLDKERHLKLTISSMIAFKKEIGKDLKDPATLKQLSESIELEDIRALLWACLRHEDKTLTVEYVGDLIDVNNLGAVTAKMLEAWAVAMPDGGSQDAPLATASPPG